MAANAWELTLDPDAFLPDTTHPVRGIVQDRLYLGFDDSTDESMISKAFRLPDAYDDTANTTVAVCFAPESYTGTGTMEFEVTFEALSSGDSVNTGTTSSFYTTTVCTVSGACPGGAGYPKILTATASNTVMDGADAGDYLRIKIMNDASASSITGDARMFWVALYQA